MDTTIPIKNICLIINNLSGGGAEKVVLNLASKLIDLGHRVDIIMLYNIISYEVYPNINVHYLKQKRTKFEFHNPIATSRLTTLLLAKVEALNIKFDLFISNLYQADYIAIKAKLPNLFCCLHCNISIELHNTPNGGTLLESIVRPIYLLIATTGLVFSKKFVRRVYRQQNLLTVSKGIQTDVLALGIQAKSIQTIHNPFNFDLIRKKADAYEVSEDNYIIHIGRFFKQKRHDVLIKAYAKSGIKEKLLLFGNMDNAAYFKKLQQLITKLGLEKKVIFKGFNPNPYPYIKKAKALVLSSDFEGLPTVLIEALILKTMVVSTDCPFGPNEILVDELSSFLSPVGDINTLTNHIKNAIDKPVEISDKYVSRFCDDIVVKQYLALIK